MIKKFIDCKVKSLMNHFETIRFNKDGTINVSIRCRNDFVYNDTYTLINWSCGLSNGCRRK